MALISESAPISNAAAGAQLLINPALITAAQIWKIQIWGAYTYLFPYINDNFRHILDDSANTIAMALVPDTEGHQAPFDPWGSNKVSLAFIRPDPILGRVHVLSDPTFTTQLELANKGIVQTVEAVANIV